MSGLFGAKVIGVTETALDAAALRQQVISNNMANVDTPGFKRSDVDFEDVLRQAVGSSGGGADSGSGFTLGANAQPRISQDQTTSMRLDGNNVDMDTEAGKMAENTLYYEGLTQLISSKFSLLRNAIKEGR